VVKKTSDESALPLDHSGADRSQSGRSGAAQAATARDESEESAAVRPEAEQASAAAPMADFTTIVSETRTDLDVSDVVLADSELPPSVSDVVLAPSATGHAPSFRMPAPPVNPRAAPPVDAPTIELERDKKPPGPNEGPAALLPGAKVDDFEVVRMLGKGAFGHVYLARQITLDRLVALKISANRGSEGRTMARLEHQHIVQVFSEKVDVVFNQRLLCMQLVPGVGLEKLISHLHSKEARTARQSQEWTGEELIGFIDKSESLPTALDPAALHDREALGDMDAVEATAWFGGRLAEALDFAHRNGVLHRDIKPANILVNPYGRPMLADFNISSQPVGSEQGEDLFGGTFAYMSPEHLDAFNPGDSTGHDAVTSRSDIYSLGLVLHQMLQGRIFFSAFRRKGSMVDTLREMANERKQEAPVCRPGLPSAHMTLERSIGRCLEPKPEDRFASGADLAAQLDGCRRLRESERQLPSVSTMFRPLLRRPFLWIIILVVLPQLVASVINIAYNLTQIVAVLNKDQQKEFFQLLNLYNAIVYPVLITAFVLAVRPVWKCWNALSRAERVPEGEVKAARLRALRLPRWIAVLVAIGWFPGGFLFPLGIALRTPPLDAHITWHFVASFCLSGMIAMAYSISGVEFIVLRGLYPGLWRDVHNYTATVREELTPVHNQLNRIEWLAGSIPLVAAISMNLLGNAGNIVAFRWLVTSLILLGIVGIHVTSAITRYLSGLIVTYTKPKG
jgi:serine/threonine protein kinase